MIIFRNPGLIPLTAIRLMGASVKTEGAFGRFGTGLKYAIATIMRGGGSIRIWRGPEEYSFTTQEVELKDTAFQEVQLFHHDTPGHPVPLGFTTELGRDWAPWMVLRELACNARDEGGDFFRPTPEQPIDLNTANWPQEDTCIVVDWPELEAELDANEHCVFAPEVDALTELHGVRVLPGPSSFLYHRGVRVWKLPKPAIFTYDITSHLDLTEDRTVKYSFIAVAAVRNMFLRMTTQEEVPLLTAAVSAKKGTWEAGFDWKGEEWGTTEPGPLWLETAAAVRNSHELGHNLADSARDVLLKHQAFRKHEAATWMDREGANENLSDAAEVLEELGFKLDPINVFITDELPGAALSAVSNGSIFITQTLLEARVVVIVKELTRRLLELMGEGDHDRLLAAATGLLFELSVGSRHRLRRELELFTEDAKTGSVADALLFAMDVRGEEFPARPSELAAEEVLY